ncbi:MAG: hypothetical protein HUK21_00540 [Fibrobacteraceae bacterium]|nr:hypothetical protein [Fibrobacteraceae bacterium]
MSKIEQNGFSSSRGFSVKLVLSVLFVVVVLFILPLYMQNRVSRMYKEAHDLSDQITFLRRDALTLEYRINQLSSLEKLSSFAERAGLGLHNVPQKVRVVGGAR